MDETQEPEEVQDGEAGRLEEPVRVVRVERATVEAAAEFQRLRAGLAGLVCRSQLDVDEFAAHVAAKLAGWDRYRRDALLVMLVLERLAGVGDDAAVEVPRALLAERVAR